MKKLLILFVFGALFHTQLIAQTQYFEFMAKANALLEAADYEAAALQFDQAFNEKEGTKWAYYYAAAAWARSGKDNPKAFRYLRKSIDLRMFDLAKLEADKYFETLKTEADWAATLKDLKVKKEAFEKGFNWPLKNKLAELHTRDQTLRKIYPTAVKKLGEDTLGIRYLEALVRMEDSICQKEVIQILDTHGWLGIQEVGEEGNQTIWLVIQHAPLEIQEKYAPMMQASVAIGESNGSDFAYLVDRILMRKGQAQLYGSQYKMDRKTRQRVFHPIQDVETVNARREALGLMPMEEYAKLIQLEYDPSIWKKE